MKQGEMRDMNATMQGVWKYLTENIKTDEGAYISYSIIRDAVGKRSRHAIAYAVERLRARGKIGIYENKIHILEPFKQEV